MVEKDGYVVISDVRQLVVLHWKSFVLREEDLIENLFVCGFNSPFQDLKGICNSNHLAIVLV